MDFTRRSILIIAVAFVLAIKLFLILPRPVQTRPVSVTGWYGSWPVFSRDLPIPMLGTRVPTTLYAPGPDDFDPLKIDLEDVKPSRPSDQTK